MVDKNFTVDLRGKVVSTKFSNVAPEKIPSHALVETLTNMAPKINFRIYCAIDMSNCQLLDEDMIYIADTVHLFDNCFEINLSGNRFHGLKDNTVDYHLFRILRQASIRHVIITHNPIASIDRKDLFTKMSENDLRKLIWIPKQMLQGYGWKNVLPDYNNSLFKLVEEAHLKYYNMIPNRSVAEITASNAVKDQSPYNVSNSNCKQKNICTNY